MLINAYLNMHYRTNFLLFNFKSFRKHITNMETVSKKALRPNIQENAQSQNANNPIMTHTKHIPNHKGKINQELDIIK